MKEILTDKENQHYIPKFYLRYFSYLNNNKQIGVYNQNNKLFIPTAKLKTQASKKYFYGKDGIIEDWLCSIESILAPILLQMITSEELPKLMTTSHADLLFFLILLDLRNPIKIGQLKKSRQLIKDRFIQLNPNNKESEIYKALENFENHDTDVMMSVLHAKDIVMFSMDLNIKLLKNTSETPFITSDFPLIKYNQFLEHRKWNYGQHNGYGTIGEQVFLPLNDKYMIILFDPNVYKVGNNKDKVVEINDNESINQMNILQILNCSSTIFFNHRVTEFYINHIINKAIKYRKANESFLKTYYVDNGSGGIKQNEEVIRIGSTDLKIKLNLQKIKFSSKANSIILDNCAAQLRPKAEEVYQYLENKKN